jgi:hypothetical protein
MIRRAAIAAAILLALQAPTAAGWKRTSLGKSTEFCSLALDANGHAHISYLAGSARGDFGLHYAFFDGKSWHRQTVDTGNVGLYNTIAVDSHGHPHIAYSTVGSQSTAMLKYAVSDGVSWTVTTVDTGGFSSDLVLDSSDHPHISYVPASFGGALRYAHHDGNNWIIETITPNTAETFGGSAIALNSAGVAHIFFSTNAGTLDWATKEFGGWVIRAVDSGLLPSVALDSADRPRVLYDNNTSLATEYAAWTGTEWSITPLPLSYGVSLALDAGDHPHVALGVLDGNQSSLTYLADDGNGFAAVHLGVPKIGRAVTIALDQLGLPHIVTLKSGGRPDSGTLLYARLQLPDLGGAFGNTSRTPVPSGDSVTSALLVSNFGTSRARAVSIQFFVSTDAVLDPGDPPAGPPRNIGTLGPGQTKHIEFRHTFASTVGGQYLFAVLDSALKNDEATEANNTVFTPIP